MANLTFSRQIEQDNDERLLKLIAQGDKVAFSHLMNRHLNAVIFFVMRYFSQRSDAEDIAQETFICLWCKAPVWNDQGVTVKAWLFKVAYHQCIDQLRKQKKQPEFNEAEHEADQAGFLERVINAQSDLEQQKLALSLLSERQRSAILLCSVKGLSNKEAAMVLNISVDAMESLLARGRRKLKQLYQQVEAESGNQILQKNSAAR